MLYFSPQEHILASGNVASIAFASHVRTLTRIIQPVLDEIGETSTAEDVAELQRLYADPSAEIVAYEQLAEAFTQAYFLKNLWKEALVFERHFLGNPRYVLDLGCGSGATVLAFLTVLDARMRQPTQVRAVLVDRCAKQLDIAQKLLGSALHTFRFVQVELEFHVGDIRQYQFPDNYFDFTICGHVLTENLDDTETILQKAVDCTAGNGKVIIIERSSDRRCWQAIRCVLDGTPIGITFGNVEEMVSRLGIDEQFYVEAGSTLKTDYLTLFVPESRISAWLVQQYFRAWNEQSVGLLDEVFSTDAVYHAKPFESPIVGLSSIRTYWEEHVMQQQNVRAGVEECVFSGNQIGICWHAEFLYAGECIDVQGMMFMTVNREGKVSSLRECFRTRKQRLPNSASASASA